VIAITRLEDALVFGAYTTVMLIAGAVLLYRRDVS
jgi:threonine aldolase